MATRKRKLTDEPFNLTTGLARIARLVNAAHPDADRMALSADSDSWGQASLWLYFPEGRDPLLLSPANENPNERPALAELSKFPPFDVIRSRESSLPTPQAKAENAYLFSVAVLSAIPIDENEKFDTALTVAAAKPAPAPAPTPAPVEDTPMVLDDHDDRYGEPFDSAPAGAPVAVAAVTPVSPSAAGEVLPEPAAVQQSPVTLDTITDKSGRLVAIPNGDGTYTVCLTIESNLSREHAELLLAQKIGA